MIARLWRGETRSEDADAYQRVLQATGVRDYRATPGNLGVWLLRSERGGRTEFALLTLWDRRESIEAFAGKQIELARYYDVDKEYLLDFRKTVEHFDVAGIWGEAQLLPQVA
jgi:heme-degrading monooxygenase HmoA